VKKILGLGASALFVSAAVAASALSGVAAAQPGGNSAVNVVGEPYYKALPILKQQGIKGTFGGSFGSDVPQSQCIVSQQKLTTQGRMILNLDCTKAAADHATDSTPSTGAAGAAPGATAPAPGNGQGTYGGPIGVPVPVG
jgi:hypothetical protein